MAIHVHLLILRLRPPAWIMNKSRSQILLLFLWLSCWLWLLAGCNGVNAHPPADSANDAPRPQIPFAKEPEPLVVPEHTMLYVSLQQSLSSATTEAGQRFAAVLDEPLMVGT